MIIHSSVAPANGQITDIQCEQSVSALGFGITGLTLSSWNNIKVHAVLVDRQKGTTTFLSKKYLTEYLEASAAGGGYYAYGVTSIKGVIEVAYGGGLKLDSNKYISISMEGIEAGASVSVHALDVEQITDTGIKYDTASVTADSAGTNINLEGVNEIILDSSKVGSTTIHFANGKSVRYQTEDWEFIRMKKDDVMRVSDVFQSPEFKVNLVALDVVDAVSMEVEDTSSSAWNVMLLKPYKVG